MHEDGESMLVRGLFGKQPEERVLEHRFVADF